MFYKLFTFLIFSSLSLSIYANPPQTKKVMHEALNSVIELFPYMTHELKFNDPNHEEKILMHLNKLASAFKSAKHNKDLKAPAFSPNYNILIEHVDDTIANFRGQNKAFARLRLNATTSICISCHSQLPEDRLSSALLNSKQMKKETFESSYEYANFLYLLRKYPEAVTEYKASIFDRIEKLKKLKKINNILGESGEYYDKTLNLAFNKILTIYTKIEQNPQLADSFLKESLTIKDLP